MTVKSVNAGESGVSGELTFSSGTTSNGNSGYIAIGTGASTAGKAGAIGISVGSGRTGTGGNMLLRAGQTMATSKSGGHVSVVGGTGGQASATFETAASYSKQQHLLFKERPLTHDHARSSPDGTGPGSGGDATAYTPGDARESDSQYGPYYQDYDVQNRYDNGVYDRSADMVDMFASYTLADDSTTTDGSGGDVVVAAGLGVGATGGDVVMMSGYGLDTTSGAVVVKSTNAGHSGWSGDLSFSSGTSSSGNSGLLAIGTGASTVGKAGSVSVGVGSGNSGIGGNMYMKAGQTWASNKDGGHVAVMGGTGGQTSAAT